MSLFKKAKTTQAPKAAAKDSKVRIKISDSSFFDKVEKLETLLDNQKKDKAKSDMIADELKELAREEWSKLYEDTGKNPGSVMLENINDSDDVAQFMFLPTDKYITINEDRADELKEAYGEDIVEEKTVFSFDNAMIEKYGEVISRLIEESEEIAEKDKEKIIKASTSFSVAKGTIDKLKDYGNVSEMMEVVRPVVAMKNVEVIKG